MVSRERNIFYELPLLPSKDGQALMTKHLRQYLRDKQIMFLNIFLSSHCIFCLMLLVVFIKLHKFAPLSSYSIIKS